MFTVCMMSIIAGFLILLLPTYLYLWITLKYYVASMQHHKFSIQYFWKVHWKVNTLKMTTMQNILRKAIYFVSMVHLPFLFKLYKRFCKGGSRYIDEFFFSLSLWKEVLLYQGYGHWPCPFCVVSEAYLLFSWTSGLIKTTFSCQIDNKYQL